MSLPKNASYLLSAKKNQLAFMSTRTSVKLPKRTLAALGMTKVEKINTRYVRLNCSYLDLLNKERAKNGEPPLDKTGPLPFGEWAIEGILIARPGISEEEETKYYLRYYPEKEFDYSETKFVIDNVVVGSSDPAAIQLKEEIKKAHRAAPSICCNVAWENILELSLCDKSGEPETDVI